MFSAAVFLCSFLGGDLSLAGAGAGRNAELGMGFAGFGSGAAWLRGRQAGSFRTCSLKICQAAWSPNFGFHSKGSRVLAEVAVVLI